MKKSIAISLHPLAAALAKAQSCTKSWMGKSEFNPKNMRQKMFFEHFDQLLKDVKLIPELHTIAHTEEEVVSKFVETGKGKSSKISQTDREFSIGAMFEIFMKWKNQGEESSMRFEGKTVMSTEMTKVAHFKGTLCIVTKTGDVAFIRLGTASSSTDLFTQVVELSQGIAKGSFHKMVEPVTAQFPFVKLDLKENYKWLRGLDLNPDSKHSHPGYTVVDALAKNELDIDNKGARIKSGVEVRMRTKGIALKPKIVKIDKPFLFWVMREGCALPIFMAACNSDVLIKSK